MPILNTPSQYGSVTKTFHWLTALLILTALPLGLLAENAPFADGAELAQKAWLFSLHKTVGVAAFFTALLRILWALGQTRPGLLNPENRLEALAAHVAHWLLYGSMVLVPLTGWIHHASTTGFAPILWPFGQSLPLVPENETLSHLMSTLHFIFMIVLVLSILAHVGGAMKHLVIDRDQTLQRMLPGRNAAPVPAPETPSRAPMRVAIAVWVIALGIGAGAGLFGGPAQVATPRPTTPPLAVATTGWQVQQGEVALTVRQFGSDVTGRFADWTAEIAFDETAKDGTYGHVKATIAIASMTLGSVTDQALGADFLNAAGFPTAVFSGDILAADTGYVAQGTLTLRGVEQPLALPFQLDIDGDTAKMTGATSVKRLDFAVGENMPDETTLGFDVDIAISLTATRAP